jgi:hypothetical protein
VGIALPTAMDNYGLQTKWGYYVSSIIDDCGFINNKTKTMQYGKGVKNTWNMSLMKLVAMLGIARLPWCHHWHLQKM